jgi:DNA-binding NtrC family response regulator
LGCRILIIDDERDFADLVRTVAVEMGHEAVAVDNADDFKANFLRDRPEIVLTDIVMPECDGIELIRWLVEQGYDSRLVAITGFNPAYAEMAGALANATGRMQTVVLGKPVALADLRRALTPDAG